MYTPRDSIWDVLYLHDNWVNANRFWLAEVCATNGDIEQQMYVLVIGCCTAYTSQLAWNYEFDFGILNNVDNISSLGWIPAGFKINIFLSHQPACTFEATSAILPFKYIKNTNPDQCMTPLEGGATHSRLTLEPFDLSVSALSITTTVSGGDTCDRFGTTVVVEMQHDQNMPILRECALVQKTE